MMRGKPAVLAVVFDFDETLVPDSTSKLLQSRGVDPHEFWTNHVRRRLEQGFDPTLAYLGLILDYVGADRPLGRLSNRDLREFGATLDADLFPGLPQLFDDLRAVAAAYSDVSVELHIISGGLLEVVAGSRMAMNRDVPADRRPVPFENMICVGDGLTDVPCFSQLKKERGASFGVFDPARKDSARSAFTELLRTDRVISMHAPKSGRATSSARSRASRLRRGRVRSRSSARRRSRRSERSGRVSSRAPRTLNARVQCLPENPWLAREPCRRDSRSGLHPRHAALSA